MSIETRGEEVYRVTQKQDGRWLWCDRYGNDGGDNIDLVKEIEPGIGYAEAVHRLLESPTVQAPKRSEPKRTPPILPATTAKALDQGREYLMGRGISLETIEYAELAGMVRYADGGVLFVGRDATDAPQSITRRATTAADPMQKRDLRGSDKSYPPILPGDSAQVWIVEDGTDALALHEIAKRNGKIAPTVIVSGGANVRSFLEQPEVQIILKRAAQVTVAGENEKNPDTQIKADIGHIKQASRVNKITGRETQHWTPKPEQGKDLADVNTRQVEKIAAARQAEKTAGREARSRGHSR